MQMIGAVAGDLPMSARIPAMAAEFEIIVRLVCTHRVFSLLVTTIATTIAGSVRYDIRDRTSAFRSTVVIGITDAVATNRPLNSLGRTAPVRSSSFRWTDVFRGFIAEQPEGIQDHEQ